MDTVVRRQALPVLSPADELALPWPHCQEMARGQLQPLPDALTKKICYQNAARIYRTPEPLNDWINRSEIATQQSTTGGTS